MTQIQPYGERESGSQIVNLRTIAPANDTFEVMVVAAELAAKIASTPFVPTAMRNQPAMVLAAILAGREMGLKPMQSLSQIAVIEGKPTISAAAARALILANGHRIWADPEPTSMRCQMHLQRRGEDHVYTSTWTIQDAQIAGLKGKPNWIKYPKAMLIARSTGDVARLGAADVLAGMPYLSEEIIDGPIDGDVAESIVAQTESTGRKTSTRRRRGTSAPPDDPPEDSTTPSTTPIQPEAQAPAPADPADPQQQTAGNAKGSGELTIAQQVAMHCRELGLDRREVILAVTGRERARDMTLIEAERVLRTLQEIKEGQAKMAKDAEGKPVIYGLDPTEGVAPAPVEEAQPSGAEGVPGDGAPPDVPGDDFD